MFRAYPDVGGGGGGERSESTDAAPGVLVKRPTAVYTATPAVDRPTASASRRGASANAVGRTTTRSARDAWMLRYQRVLVLIDFLVPAIAGMIAYLVRFGADGSAPNS